MEVTIQMEKIIEQLTEHTYKSVLLSWFNSYEWTAFPFKSLPVHSYFIRDENGKYLCFSSIYLTDSNIAYYGITMKNPEAGNVSEDLDFLINELCETVKSEGYEFVHYATGPESVHMVKRMEKNKFVVTDRGDGYLLTKSLTGESIQFLDE